METTASATARGWNVLERDGAILWRQYPFGGGLATTMVFRGAGDGLIVVSPGNNIDEGALDELSDFGKVVALVASNAYHWLGQPFWRKRFPEARTFSPAQGIKRLSKKMPDVKVEPLDALGPLLGDRATVADPPGFRVGNAFATVRGKKNIAYTGTTKIDRRDFGMTFGPLLDGALVVGNDIAITIETTAVEQ